MILNRRVIIQTLFTDKTIRIPFGCPIILHNQPSDVIDALVNGAH